jgi:hypothetical protein
MFFSEMEGMNQYRIQYIYTWKCHNEILCIDTLNKQKCLIFISKAEDRNINQFFLGVGTSGRGEDIRKEYRRGNMVETCT